MEKLKNFIHKYQIIDFVLIALIIIIFSFLFSNHMHWLAMDRGREFLFPQEILNGKVPYKDILLIYFPTAYYINALIYKLLGVSIDSLITSQTIFCICFMCIYYMLARIFLERKSSLIISFFIICSCIFTRVELFSFIIPYSYSTAYGCMCFILCTFLFIKLFKTGNLAYLYSAALMTGFCFIFKLEFFIAYLLLIAALFLYKKLKPVQYLKILLLSIIFPAIMTIFMLLQGVGFNDILAAIDFGYKFSTTPVISMYLSDRGMYPTFLSNKIESIVEYTPYLISIILLSFAAWKLKLKYKKNWILLLVAAFIWINFNITFVQKFFIYLPMLIFIILCFKYKELYKEDTPMLFTIIAALLCSQREFFMLSLISYGVYSFPLLILALCLIIRKFLPKIISGIKTESFTNYVIIILSGLFLISLCIKNMKTSFPIKSNKGTIYTNYYNYYLFNQSMSYINQNIDKNKSLLVLPEGLLINFLTDRKTDMKCHMMDRLYHDAFGPEQARDKIASTNSDYIIILIYSYLSDFYSPFLYQKGESLAYEYINEHYKKVKEINFGENMSEHAYIYKKIK